MANRTLSQTYNVPPQETTRVVAYELEKQIATKVLTENGVDFTDADVQKAFNAAFDIGMPFDQVIMTMTQNFGEKAAQKKVLMDVLKNGGMPEAEAYKLATKSLANAEMSMLSQEQIKMFQQIQDNLKLLNPFASKDWIADEAQRLAKKTFTGAITPALSNYFAAIGKDIADDKRNEFLQKLYQAGYLKVKDRPVFREKMSTSVKKAVQEAAEVPREISKLYKGEGRKSRARRKELEGLSGTFSSSGSGSTTTSTTTTTLTAPSSTPSKKKKKRGGGGNTTTPVSI